MNDDLLGIYLNDQLAAGVVWRELAWRAQRANDGTPLGTALRRVAKGIAEDVATFEQIMDRLEVRRSRLKPLLAMAAERLGRLKPNGRLREYSPLSRFTELDLLALGIAGKEQLWENLRDYADLQSRLPYVDFDQLIERARKQRAEIEQFRPAAGRAALGGGGAEEGGPADVRDRAGRPAGGW